MMSADDRTPEQEEAHPFTNTPKSFLQFLAEQGQGAVTQELSEKLRDLIEAIENNFNKFPGKTSGELSLKFKITLDRGVYQIVTDYAVKHPKAPAADTIMWLGRDGNLAATNPNQLAMQFGKPQVVA